MGFLLQTWTSSYFFFKDYHFKMNVSKACIWPSMCHIFWKGGGVWLDLLTVNFKESQSLQRSLMSVKLTNSTFQFDAEFWWHFSQSKEHPGPADSFLRANNLLLSAGSSQLERSLWLPEENTQLKWSIVFHGLCPNDWWHFLRHLQRWPLANMECYLNAKILPWCEHSHVLVSQCFTLECSRMLQLIKVLII